MLRSSSDLEQKRIAKLPPLLKLIHCAAYSPCVIVWMWMGKRYQCNYIFSAYSTVLGALSLGAGSLFSADTSTIGMTCCHRTYYGQKRTSTNHQAAWLGRTKKCSIRRSGYMPNGERDGNSSSNNKTTVAILQAFK